MNIKNILQSQYLASLAMLKQAVVKCPPEAWDNPDDIDRVWFIAHHALHYGHQYLKAKDKGYPRWEHRGHRDPGQPLSREEILEMLAKVEQDVVEQIPIMDLEKPRHATSALANLFELQIYNIRHIQQHTGEIYDRLSRYRLKLEWASSRNLSDKRKKTK